MLKEYDNLFPDYDSCQIYQNDLTEVFIMSYNMWKLPFHDFLSRRSNLSRIFFKTY